MIFLISISFEKNVTITNIKNIQCSSNNYSTTFQFDYKGSISTISDKDYTFSLFIKGNNKKYTANCKIPNLNKTIINPDTTQSTTDIIDTTSDTTSDTITDTTTDTITDTTIDTVTDTTTDTITDTNTDETTTDATTTDAITTDATTTDVTTTDAITTDVTTTDATTADVTTTDATTSDVSTTDATTTDVTKTDATTTDVSTTDATTTDVSTTDATTTDVSKTDATTTDVTTTDAQTTDVSTTDATTTDVSTTDATTTDVSTTDATTSDVSTTDATTTDVSTTDATTTDITSTDATTTDITSTDATTTDVTTTDATTTDVTTTDATTTDVSTTDETTTDVTTTDATTTDVTTTDATTTDVTTTDATTTDVTTTDATTTDVSTTDETTTDVTTTDATTTDVTTTDETTTDATTTDVTTTDATTTDVTTTDATTTDVSTTDTSTTDYTSNTDETTTDATTTDVTTTDATTTEVTTTEETTTDVTTTDVSTTDATTTDVTTTDVITTDVTTTDATTTDATTTDVTTTDVTTTDATTTDVITTDATTTDVTTTDVTTTDVSTTDETTTDVSTTDATTTDVTTTDATTTDVTTTDVTTTDDTTTDATTTEVSTTDATTTDVTTTDINTTDATTTDVTTTDVNTTDATTTDVTTTDVSTTDATTTDVSTTNVNTTDNTTDNTTNNTTDNTTDNTTNNKTDNTTNNNTSNTNPNIRILEESFYTGDCEINVDVDEALTISNNNIEINPSEMEEGINLDNNINLDLEKCAPKSKSDYESKLFISFKQLNNLRKENNNLYYYFYGIITENLEKNYLITMDVNLIDKGFQEENTTSAFCLLTEDIIILEEQPKVGQFNCTISNVKDGVKSFVYHSSKVISGVPKDTALLNPEVTEQYISRGDLIPVDTNSTIEPKPSFTIKSIDYTDCKEKGIFTLKGDLTLKINDDLKFQLPLSYPENVTAECTIKSTDKTSDVEINCHSNENFNNSIIKIAQNSIFDDKKNEILTIEKYEKENEGGKKECGNSKIITVKEKISTGTPLSFRQVSKYTFQNKKASFFFYGLSSKNLKKGTKIIITVLLYFKDNNPKKEVDITCTLDSDVNPPTGGFAQGDFNCEKDDIEGDLDDLQILSSYNITGTDKLKDDQKSPKLTDKKIKDTSNESGIGKEVDYSSSANKISSLPILSIKTIKNENNGCLNNGKIQLIGSFTEDIKQKFDFEIPLAYPLTSIKCDAPKIKKNINVNIDCKVQNELYEVKEILIEPIIIKKKNKEFLIVNEFHNDNLNINCVDYNKKQKEISKKQYESDYTLLQANSLNIISGRLLFNLIIYTLNSLRKTITLNYILRSNSYLLRNLQEQQNYEESQITCNLNNDDTNDQVGHYVCEKTVSVSDKNLVESLIIKSDEISGIRNDNNDLKETDDNINKGTASNYSDPDNKEILEKKTIPIIKSNNIDTSSCNISGTFTMKGTLNEGEILKEGEDDIIFTNPPDSGALCKYSKTDRNKNINIECENKNEFSDQNLIIGNQFLNETYLLEKFITENPISCEVGSLSYKEVEDINEEKEIENNKYYSKTNSSSGGLSGGAIAAIVIVCSFVVVAVGVLIVLVKNGLLLSSKVKEEATTIPQISSSSANII